MLAHSAREMFLHAGTQAGGAGGALLGHLSPLRVPGIRPEAARSPGHFKAQIQ